MPAVKFGVGVLEEECRELNKRFFTFHTKQRPYIILKWAQSSDGFLAPDPEEMLKEGRYGSPTNTPNNWSINGGLKNRRSWWEQIQPSPIIPSSTPACGQGNDPVRVVLDRTVAHSAGISPF